MSYGTGSLKCWEFLTLLRAEPMTREDLCHRLGWAKRTVCQWVRSGLRAGVLVEQRAPMVGVVHGHRPKLIAVAPAWLGKDEA